MPSIVKRGESYRIFVSLPKDGSGKPVRKTTTYRPPKGTSEKKGRFLAEAYAYEFEEKLHYFSELNDSCRLKDFCEWYFKEIAPKKVKEHTRDNNQKLLQNYVLPQIGNLRLRDLTSYRIDCLVSDLLISGGLKGGRPLSAGTVGLTRAALSTVLNTAVKKGILKKNPVAGSTPPRGEKKEREFLDDEEAKILLDKLDEIPNEQVRRAIRLLLYTGLRRGELLALHWRDVDFIKREITVRYTLYRASGKVKMTSPKSRASCRVLPLPPSMMDELMEQMVCVEKLKRKAGRNWEDTDAVFVNRNGGYLNGEYLNNTFKKFLKENGFPPMHLHDLRHANASILINRGVPMKIVSEHLGHTSQKTTEEFYTHMFTRSRQVTADVLASALEEGEESTVLKLS